MGGFLMIAAEHKTTGRERRRPPGQCPEPELPVGQHDDAGEREEGDSDSRDVPCRSGEAPLPQWQGSDPDPSFDFFKWNSGEGKKVAMIISDFDHASSAFRNTSIRFPPF